MSPKVRQRTLPVPQTFLPVLKFLLGFAAESTPIGDEMVQRVSTVAFEGIEARAVDVQVQVAPGLPAFTIMWTILF